MPTDHACQFASEIAVKNLNNLRTYLRWDPVMYRKRRQAAWLSGYRRLSHRYERQSNSLAFLGLAAARCCYKHLVRGCCQSGSHHR